MRVILDMDDGEIVVTVGSERHRVLEAHFRWEGQLPVMDLTHPLADVEPVGVQSAHVGPRTMDSL